MFETIAVLMTAGIAGAGAVFGYFKSRRFVRERLRFVDAAQSRAAVFIAAGATLLLLTPVAWALPFVDAGSVLLVTLGIGAGVNAGRKDIRRYLKGPAS